MDEHIKERITKIIEMHDITPTKFETLCGLSKSYLQRVKNDVGSSKMLGILRAFPDINPVWLLTGEGPMMREDPEPAPVNTRPDIPLDVFAGSLGIGEACTLEQCGRLAVIPSLPDYDATISVNGDSMYPLLMSGDRIAIRQLSGDYIQWGAIHVISTPDGAVVKRIYDDGDSLLCKSENPDYPPFKIPKSPDLRIYRVIGMLRAF